MPELGFYSRELLVDVCQLNRLGKILQRAFNWDAGKRLGSWITFCLGLFKITAPRADCVEPVPRCTIFAASSDTSTSSAHLPSLVRNPPNHASNHKPDPLKIPYYLMDILPITANRRSRRRRLFRCRRVYIDDRLDQIGRAGASDPAFGCDPEGSHVFAGDFNGFELVREQTLPELNSMARF